MQRTTAAVSFIPAPCRKRVDSSQHEVYSTEKHKLKGCAAEYRPAVKTMVSRLRFNIYFISTTTIVVTV